MNMKFCLPQVPGRGAGLGNELIPWARAFVAATVLNARLLPPAFGLNQRRYWRHFSTPRYDWAMQRALRAALPVVEFDERAFLDHGGDCLSAAIREHAELHGLHDRKCFVWTTQGMWGGYRHLVEAREFVRATLYRSRYAARNQLTLRARLDPAKITVGMHVRLGDFVPANVEADYRNRFNVSLPPEWYARIANRIREHLGSQVQFLIVSDGTPEQIAAIAKPIDAITTYDIPDADCSDLLALADCDLLVCSVSSYSAWAAFLSSAPYLWFEPNLNHHPEDIYSIWGHEPEQKKTTGATARAIAKYVKCKEHWRGRGIAVGMDGDLPLALFDDILEASARRSIATDLVTYGVVPASKVGA